MATRAKIQSAAAATGNGTTLDVQGFSTVAAQVEGTFVGTITWEGRVVADPADTTTWTAIYAINVNTGTSATTATTTGIYQLDVSAFSEFRARVSAWTSGTITVIAVASLGEGQNAPGPLPTGSTTLGNGQATAGAASGALVAARVGRKSVTVRNIHATESCYIGAGTVSAANGMLLKALESVALTTTAAINGIRAGSTDVTVAYLEEY